MKRIFSLLAVSIISVVAVASPVAAAKPRGGGGATSTPLGIDVSWPQCGKRLPSDHAFAIVGVNGGTAADANKCLKDQLVWAHSAPGLPNQPKAQLYVNTANPGEVINQVNTWPNTNTDKSGLVSPNPYGHCSSGANDIECSWQYGWNRSEFAVSVFKDAAIAARVNADPGSYVWWLDVETMNTWQSESSDALAKNAATLEGMAAYYQQKFGAKVGIYSTNYQWGIITGGTLRADSNLKGLDSWLAGALNQKDAKAKCSSAPLHGTGGNVTLVQFVSKNLDYNYSCVN